MLCDSLWLASENDSLQLTRQSLMVVLISLYYSNIRIFFPAVFRQTKFDGVLASQIILSRQKFGGEFGCRRQIGGVHIAAQRKSDDLPSYTPDNHNY